MKNYIKVDIIGESLLIALDYETSTSGSAYCREWQVFKDPGTPPPYTQELQEFDIRTLIVEELLDVMKAIDYSVKSVCYPNIAGSICPVVKYAKRVHHNPADVISVDFLNKRRQT